MKYIYCVECWTWDQWENYGNGSTNCLKVFSNKDKATRYLQSINICKYLKREYPCLKETPIETSNEGDRRSYYIPGPIGTDVSIVYSIERKRVC